MACAQGAGAAPATEVRGDVPPAMACGLSEPEAFVPARVPEAFASFGTGEISNTIFLNRCAGGCRVMYSEVSDALADRSSIPTRASSRITEFAHGDEVWDEVVDCVRDVFLPYNVVITDVDPAPSLHHEAIVAGTGDEIGHGAGLGGLSLEVCEPRDNAISFTFANFYGPDAQAICEVVAHEAAHAYGLDHVFDCADPLGYLSSCGPRFFRDEALPCGEFEARACRCGGDTQNAHRTLLSVFGPGEITPAPTPVILLPADGDQVPSQFSVYARASSKRGLAGVELWVNGTRMDTLAGQLNNDVYVFDARNYAIADGVLDIEVRAADDLGSEGRAMVTVTKGRACERSSDCLVSQTCNAGRCEFPLPDAALGDSCETDEDCVSELCLERDGERRCSDSCTPGLEQQCVSSGAREVECVAAESGGVCWPTEERKTGGCHAAAPGDSTGGVFVVVTLLAVLGARRRGRARCEPRSERRPPL